MRHHNKFYLNYPNNEEVEIKFVLVGTAAGFGPGTDKALIVFTFTNAQRELAANVAAALNTAYDKGWERGREAVLEAFKEAVGMGE
jgi:hypothetical protein